MTLVAVAANKMTPGYPNEGFRATYRVTPLVEALERTYSTDAHLVAYIVEGNPYPFQPRVNKPGLADFFLPVSLTTFFADVDNANHAPWTPELTEAALAQYEALSILQTAGVYHTAHGRRIVQPLAEPIRVDRAELYIREYLFELERAGLPVDWSCADWTRHFRLPNVRRDGRTFRAPFMDLSRMRPIEVAPIEWAPPPETKHGGPRAPRQPTPEPAWTSTLPYVYRAHVDAIARAIRGGVSENWHAMYLALSGALARKIPAEHVPEMVREIALAAGSVKPESHTQGARDTVKRHRARLSCTGFAELQRGWPMVADAVSAATARGFEAHARSLATAPSNAVPVAEATAAIENVLRRAPDGLSLVKAGCGVGKTKTAVTVAVERAGKKHVSPNALGKRAPAQSKTSISVDKNALAIQVTSDLRAQGVAVKRVFGPLSVLGPDNKPVCRYHDVAEPLVAGGQSMQWEFCLGRGHRKCEYYDDCPARDGVDGPDDARVTVGSHAMIGELDSAAGSTGVLVIDEPPVVLETESLAPDDIEAALKCAGAFEHSYAEALTPVLLAVRDWSDPAISFADLTDTLDVSSGLPKTPPIRPEQIHSAKRSLARAVQLGAASKVMGALHRAITSDVKLAVRLVERPRDGERTVVITGPREHLQKALRREGAVVVMDANAELHRPIYAKIVGYEPPLHVFEVPDGAPIERTHLRCASATRKGWISHGRLVLDAGVVTAVRAVIEWARGRLAIITFAVLELALRAALGEDVAADWTRANQTARALDAAKEVLGPVMRSYEGAIVLGHYGGVRGLNTMADADCIATIGDPWPNLGEVEHDVAFLGIEGGWESRLEALCRAELEQAHGRLRTVHRTRSGRALHVGGVLPSGYGWSTGLVTFRSMARGPSPAVRTMGAAELRGIVDRLGGVRATARALGCGVSTVSRYLTGRGVPPATTVELRNLADRELGNTCEPELAFPSSHLRHSLSSNRNSGTLRSKASANPVNGNSGTVEAESESLAIGNSGTPGPRPAAVPPARIPPPAVGPSADLRAAVMARLAGKLSPAPANDDLQASGS